MLITSIGSNLSIKNNKSLRNSVAFGEKSLTEKKENDYKESSKLGVLAGSTLGVLASIFLMAKHQSKLTNKAVGMFNIHYTPRYMLGVGTASVLGGLAGGVLTGDKKDLKPKLKESMHQFIGNILTPLIFLKLGMVAIEKFHLQNAFVKPGAKNTIKTAVLKALPDGISSLASVIIGVNVGNSISDKVTSSVFKEKTDRKVNIKDFCVHADDLTTMAVAMDRAGKFKSILAKILPFSYVISGYESGVATKKSVDLACK